MCVISFLGISHLLKKGYGRCEKEADINCIKNLLQILLEDESILV